MKVRNTNVDFFRGIAVLSVLLIHTVFHSGASYVPEHIRSLSLLIDVPLFVFIAVYTFSFSISYSKSIKSIFSLFKKYVFSITLYSIFIIIIWRSLFTVSDFISSLFFIFSPEYPFISVSASVWFMPMFIKVLLLCPAIICLTKYFYKDKYVKILCLVFGLLLFLYVFGRYHTFYLDSELLQYSLFYLLGFLASKMKISSLKHFLILEGIVVIGLLLSFRYSGNDLLDIQRLKFEYSMIYFMYALLFIIIVWYFNDRIQIKNNPCHWFGKNAIWFYFSQGISATLCYSIVKLFEGIRWYITLPIVFLCNLLIAVVICICLKGIYTFISIHWHLNANSFFDWKNEDGN